MKLLNTIRILSGALFISLCCLTASCNFLEIVPVEQADLDDATQDFNSTLGFLHSCYAGIQSPVAFENTEASADEYAVPLEYSLQGYNSLKVIIMMVVNGVTITDISGKFICSYRN